MTSDASAAVLSSATESRAKTLVYVAAFTYMITLGLTGVLIPLYALSLGYDLAELGFLVGSQAIFGLTLRLFAGAIADRFGERWVLWFSFATMVAGAAVFAFSTSFWALVGAQTFLGFSRATYWTATQTYASSINRVKAAEILGRIGSSGNTGSVIGTFLSGVLVIALGYEVTFLLVAGVALAGLLGSLGLPPLPRKAALRGFRQSLAPVPGIARSKGMLMGGIAAFYASTSMILTMVLFIPYFQEIGYDEASNGMLRSVGVVSSIILGIVFGRVFARLGSQALFTAAFGLMGVTVGIIPFVGDSTAVLILLMLAYGVLHGVMGIMYPLTASQHSAPEQRGVAMGYVGLYWGTAQLVVPAAFGVIAAAMGLELTFWIAAAIFLAGAAAMPAVYPRLVARARA